MAEQGGKNMSDLKQEISDTIHNIKQAKLDRADVNADIQAMREKMAARGIPKAALDMAMKYLDMDPEKREGFDVAYALVREAGGLPLQEDLFQAADRMAKDAMPGDGDKPEDPPAETKAPDAGKIAEIFRAEDTAKTAGKRVLEPTGEHKGAIN